MRFDGDAVIKVVAELSPAEEDALPLEAILLHDFDFFIEFHFLALFRNDLILKTKLFLFRGVVVRVEAQVREGCSVCQL